MESLYPTLNADRSFHPFLNASIQALPLNSELREIFEELGPEETHLKTPMAQPHRRHFQANQVPQCADKANEAWGASSLTRLDVDQIVTSGDFSRHGGSRFERACIYRFLMIFEEVGTDASIAFDQIGYWTKLIK